MVREGKGRRELGNKEGNEWIMNIVRFGNNGCGEEQWRC